MTDFSKQWLESPSGFPDLGPGEAIALRHMIDIIRKNYELAGYVPIETPLVERPEVLSAKAEGEIKTQMYGLRLMNPAPGAIDDTKGLALRFDQTVPLARFVARNYSSLSFPFRRYVIGPVFRGERPKDGRYRQFIQADIDVIGDGILDVLHDAEMVSVIDKIFSELAIGSFTIRINNRKILEGIMHSFGLNSKEQISRSLGIIDRMEKTSRESVIQLLLEIGLQANQAEELLAFLTDNKTTNEALDSLKSKSFNNLYSEGVQELEKVIEAVRALGVSEERFCVDLSIARGLNYYTGTVYETRFDAYPDLGSIASGGRYDNLTETFIHKKLPGVGISIGVTRLLLRLIKEKLLSIQTTTIAPVLVTTAGGITKFSNVYLRQAARLRNSKIATEIYLADKPLGKQMQFANRRGYSVVVIATEENIRTSTVIVRDLRTGYQEEISDEELVENVHELLNKTGPLYQYYDGTSVQKTKKEFPE